MPEPTTDCWHSQVTRDDEDGPWACVECGQPFAPTPPSRSVLRRMERASLVEQVARAQRRHFHAGGHPDDYVAAGHDRDPLACQWCWESAEVAVEALADMLPNGE